LVKILNKVTSIWENYWFENSPAKISLACIRIAVYICILQSLAMIWDITNTGTFLRGQNSSWYSPVGILQLLGHNLPSVRFFIFIKYVALVSSLLALFGLFTIPSSIISFTSNQFLFCLLYSWGQPWSHGFNTIFLAQLALVFSPAADSISLDYFIKRIQNKLTRKPGWYYVWAVRLAQCIVVLMFFNGFFFKWVSSPILFRWAFSDNLRNTIVAEYLQQNMNIPSYLLYIINHPYLYKTIACLNLFSQFSAIFACVFVRKPWVRIVVALLVILELLGFDFVMHLGAPQWYALLAVFVDWDYFIARLKKVKNSNPQNYNSLQKPGKKIIITTFITCFLSFYLLVAFNPWYGLQEKLKPYPFTRFAVYNSIEAQKPYNKHLSWPIEQFAFKVFIDSSFNPKSSLILNTGLYQMNNFYFSEKNKSKFLTACKTILQNSGFKHITSIQLYKDYSEIPPYPHNPQLHLLAEGLQCKMDSSGAKYILVHKSVDSLTHQLTISINFFGYARPLVKFFIQNDLNHVPASVEFKRSAQNYITDSSINKDYIRIEVYSAKSQTFPDVYYIEPG
jgi:hypothetical protein